ncbi:MAG: TonB-dependent receptor [Bryobacterales bacterium]|nr:TonB-dependent receptor [Bryobacterales bacterium]
MLVSSAAFAQTNYGRITGRVLDPQSAVVPGVEVVAKNDESGIAVRSRTNNAGVYALSFLQPGRYTISAAVEGFKKYQRHGIEVETAEVLDLDIVMELGNVTEVATVVAEAPMLETGSSTMSQFMDSRIVSEMPISGRQAFDLVRLSGGVVDVGRTANQKPQFSLAGGRVLNQMFWLDGSNDQNVRIGIGQAEYEPPVEVIQEFRVLQNNYAAEYGGSAGGAIVSTTKSGTNSFHGSAYEYFRNDRLDAADFFAPIDSSTGTKIKAPLRYNQFGATAGGPVIRNKTHFFVGYEGRRRNDGSTQILTVPTLLERQGDFSQTTNSKGALIGIYDPATTRASGASTVRDRFPNNVIPATQIDPIAKQLAQYWPLPNKAAVNLAGAQNLSGNLVQRSPSDNLLGRLDQSFGDMNRFYFRFIYARQPFTWTSNYPEVEADPRQNFYAIRPTYYLLFSDTHTFTPNLIMDVRYAFSNRKNQVRSAGVGSDVIDRIGLSGVPAGAFPAISVAGIAGLGNGREVDNYPIRQHQFVDSLTLVRGRHLMKFGGEIRQNAMSIRQRQQISGSYSFATTGTGLPGNSQTGIALASFLVGFGNTFAINDTDPLERSSRYLAGFWQDDWKVTDTLTLNIGVRWETDTPLKDKNRKMNGFDATAINPVSGTPGVVRFAGLDGWPDLPYETDRNNFGPRFGFAWRPLGSDKWVVRGGYGIFYEHPFDGDVTGAAALGFQTSANLSSPDSGITPAFYLSKGIQGVTLKPSVLDDSFGAVAVGKSAKTSVSFFERNRGTGYAQQYNFGVQRQLPGAMILDLSYVGNLSRRMPVANLTLNQVPPDKMGAGNAQIRRPFPQFSDVTTILPNIGSTNYHAGLLRIEKRLSRGVSFLGTYTWSRNIGDLDETAGYGDNQTYQDFYNRRADKGPSTIDIVHRFMWSSLYDLPLGKGRRWMQQGPLAHALGGWTVGSIVAMQSGGPFTVQMQTNTTNAFPAGALRANTLRDANLPVGQRTIERWFDTDAFVAPVPNTFGNAGRGIIRADGRVNFDFSILKNFYVAEKVYTQFRGELFNAFNHPDFGTPNHSMGSSAFGVVGSATDARVIQLGLRLVF